MEMWLEGNWRKPYQDVYLWYLAYYVVPVHYCFSEPFQAPMWPPIHENKGVFYIICILLHGLHPARTTRKRSKQIQGYPCPSHLIYLRQQGGKRQWKVTFNHNVVPALHQTMSKYHYILRFLRQALSFVCEKKLKGPIPNFALWTLPGNQK